MSSVKEKRDIDDIDTNALFSPDEVTNDALSEGIKALSGVDSKMSSPAQTAKSSPSKGVEKKSAASRKNAASVTNPVDKTDDSSSSSDDDEDASTLELSQLNDRISSLYKQLKIQKEHNRGLSLALKIQGGQLNDLENVLNKQEARIRVLEEEVKFYKEDYKSGLKDLEERFNSKHNETVRVMHETPDVIDRLVQSTNQVMSHLPEETKKTLKKVELTEPERNTIQTLRTITAAPKRKLPKHAR